MDINEAFKLVEKAVLAKEGRNLNKAEVQLLQGTWHGMTYEQIAEKSGYAVNYLMRDVAPKFWRRLSEALGEEVNKTNFRVVLERREREAVNSGITQERSRLELVHEAKLSPSAKQNPHRESPQQQALNAGVKTQTFPSLQKYEHQPVEHEEAIAQTRPHQDWGAAPDVLVFYGRTEELAELQQWVVKERCRLVALLGFEGIGKTTLSVKLAKQIQEQFDYVIWRSLKQSPSVHELLTNLLQFLPAPPSTTSNNLALSEVSPLIETLRAYRCLVVLDNFETILQSGELAGQYREGYNGYGELLRRVGEEFHQSCVILTSLEKPREIAKLEGKTLPVRSLTLLGLQEADAREILKTKGLSGEDQWNNLIKQYRGNPLALKLVATTIKEVFDGQIAEFLRRKTLVFGELHELLNQPFNRLSHLETEIMYWLAIESKPCSISTLEDDIWLPISKRGVFEALVSLKKRSLVDTSPEGGESLFELQPVVREYVIDRFIEQVSQEIERLLKTQKIEDTNLFRSHAFVKESVKNNDEETGNAESTNLLTAVVNRLRTLIRSETKITQPLNDIVQGLLTKTSLEVGYAKDNISALLQELNFSG